MLSQFIAQIEVKNCAPNSGDNSCLTTLPSSVATRDTLITLLGVVFAVFAAVAVIIIIVQAIHFIMSKGEPDKVVDARRGIIYAVIGLGVAISAEIIVNVVIGRI